MYCSESVLLASRYWRRLWIDLKNDSCVEGAGAFGCVDDPRPCDGGFAIVPFDALAAGLLEEEPVALVVCVAALSTRDEELEGLIVEASDEGL